MRELSINENVELKCVKEYNLAQYTPHIHFQADEEGACLRASEVKPKLDQFIFHHMENKINKQWLIGDDDRKALDYKMSFYVKENNKTETFEIPEYNNNNKRKPSYFTYFGDVRKTIKNNSIHMSIVSKNPELLKIIDKCIGVFFSVTCFGLRSTKGFGSYRVEEKNVDYKEIRKYITTFYTIPIWNGNALEEIMILSNMMKAGINHGGYYKGRIFRYYTEAGVGSDKAFMKQKIHLLAGEKDDCKGSESKKKYDSYIYSRGALGIAPSYEFRKKPDEKNRKHGTTREGMVLTSNEKIERFNNPVHFVVREKEILIIPTPIPGVLREQSITFSKVETDGRGKIVKGKENKPIIQESQTCRLPVLVKADPDRSKGEFNLEAFLSYFVKEFNSRKDFENAPEIVKRFDKEKIMIKEC